MEVGESKKTELELGR